MEILLPQSGGALAPYQAGQTLFEWCKPKRPFSRRALAAAHVVADPRSGCDPWTQTAIDWDATLAYRQHLWDYGFGIAEAMDTAQRGMGLDWPQALELIRRSAELARTRPGAVLASGAGTDHLDEGQPASIEHIIAAYEEQCAAVEHAGSRIILMASRALAANAKNIDDYARVYERILSQVKEPVILHWLGDMFDPALQGYWGSSDIDAAMAACLDIIAANATKIDGIKISLLDGDKEITMRRRLPDGVTMYTGDDFNYVKLIAGDDKGYSDALLGIFDPIAPAASAALAALAGDDTEAYERIFAPTVTLSRQIFAAPTCFYKTGVVFMAYLNGHQDHFTMVGGQESARSTLHMAKLFRLADRAGLLVDPELAVRRMRAYLAPRGVGA